MCGFFLATAAADAACVYLQLHPGNTLANVGAEGVIIVASELVVHTFEKKQSEQSSKLSVYAQHINDNNDDGRKQANKQKKT